MTQTGFGWTGRARLAVVLTGLALALSAGLASRAHAIMVCSSPNINAPSTLDDAQEGASYSYQVPPGCGSRSASGLPSGLTITSSGLISGTAPSTIQTYPVTLTATMGSDTVNEKVELPVVQTITADAKGGELTGTTNDGSSVYVAGSSAGDVYKLTTGSPPLSSSILSSGLNFPAAVSTDSGNLYAAQFGAPAGAGDPVLVGPTSTGTLSNPGDGDMGCTKPDAVAATHGTFQTVAYNGFYYSCAGSSTVWADAYAPPGLIHQAAVSGLASNAVPSGIAFITDSSTPGDAVVADARNGTLSYISGFPIFSVTSTVSLPPGSTPANVAYDPTFHIAYVADPGTNSVSEVSVDSSAKSLTEAGEIGVGSRPFGVATNGDNTLVVTNSGSNTADVISPLFPTPTIDYAPTVGNTPDGVTMVGNEAFVADERGGTVTVIDPPAAAKGLHKKLTITHATRRRRRRHHKAHSSALSALDRQVLINPLVAPLSGN